MNSRKGLILLLVAVLLGAAFAWYRAQDTWVVVRAELLAELQEERETLRKLNALAEDKLRSADIELRKAQARIDGLDREVSRRVRQVRTQVRDYDASRVADELNRFGVGSETEGMGP